MNGWRDPARVADNWRAVRRMLRLYGYAAAGLILLGLAALWHLSGYWQGYEDGRAGRYEDRTPSG